MGVVGEYAANVLIAANMERCLSKSAPAVQLVLVLFFGIAACGQARPVADVILTNGRVYTVNAQQPWAEAIAIKDGKILAVGKSSELAAFRGSKTEMRDAGGRLVLPGFVDCHIHFMDGSLGLTRVDLNDAGSVAEIQKRVKAYADAHPREAWIQGMGWTYPTFGPSALPNKKILDDVVSDRPVFLSAFDGHSSWANSKALEMAGITRDTPDPPNGKIVRDDKGRGDRCFEGSGWRLGREVYASAHPRRTLGRVAAGDPGSEPEGTDPGAQCGRRFRIFRSL